MTGPTPDLADEEGLWVRVDANVNPITGAVVYGPVVTWQADRSWSLRDTKDAHRYAAAVTAVAVAAEHDAALVSALREAVAPDAIVQLIYDVRGGEDTRPPVEVLPGMVLMAIATLDGRATVGIDVGGEEPAQMTASAARDHAAGVLAATAAAGHDQTLHDTLVRHGVESPSARGLIGTLGGYWPKDA